MSNKRKKFPIKREIISCGLAVCRVNDAGNAELIGIQKRHTYQFVDFIFGKYNVQSDARLIYLFSNMTSAEKLDILTFDFEMLWSKLWISYTRDNQYKMYGLFDDAYATKYNSQWNTGYINKTHHYMVEYFQRPTPPAYLVFLQKKLKFETITGTEQARIHIRNLINDSKNATLKWEIPKGQLQSNETELDCAVREFVEETLIPKNKIRILHPKPIVETYRDGAILYTNRYYLADLLDTNVKLRVYFNITNQSCEISHMRFLAISGVENLQQDVHSKHTMKKILKTYKKYFDVRSIYRDIAFHTSYVK
ncbi:MAG TPA: NUDIX domain-containing protein [Candidatus Paceibacterota bacterium]